MDYAQAGVNLDLGNTASQILYNASKLTWKNRKGLLGDVTEIFEDFSGLRAINVGSLAPETFMNINFDGIGTKVEIAERVAKHDTVAFDLFAMVCDDAIVRGAEPVLVGSILDVKTLGQKNENYIEFVKQLAKGYINAAEAARVAVINGEVAELGHRINGFGEFNYNWGAGVVWFAKKERLFTGTDIKEGDYLVGLEEKGFRSNGLSIVRRILEEKIGKNWHEDKKLAESILTPSTIYSKAVVDMFGGYCFEPKIRIKAFAHITGGGIPEKLGRVLKPSGLGAEISEPFDYPKIVAEIKELGNVSAEEAYRTWNMGQGGIIITNQPDEAISIAKKHGIKAKIIGKTIKAETISINSQEGKLGYKLS